MLLGDIAARYNVRNVDALRTLVKKVAETVRTDVSFSTPHNALKDIGYGISKDTVISYVGHAREAYLLFSVTNATARFVKRGGRAGMAVPTGRARAVANLWIRLGVGGQPHLGQISLRNTRCGVPDPKGSSCFLAFSQ